MLFVWGVDGVSQRVLYGCHETAVPRALGTLRGTFHDRDWSSAMEITRYSVLVNTEGAAFEDAAVELAHILRKLADHMEAGTAYTDGDVFPLFDHNGNRCGEAWASVDDYDNGGDGSSVDESFRAAQ